MTRVGDAPPFDGRRVLLNNPSAGGGDHSERVHALATARGFAVRDTTSGEDLVEAAATAAGDASIVAAAGGDGTLTRAVRGIDRADALGDTLFAPVPAGTGNDFAGNLGHTGLEAAFDLIDDGRRRRIDLGVVDGTPFLNSVVAGLTAEASADTTAEEKARWGPLAYAVATVRTAVAFEPLRLTVEPADGESWECEADLVLIGNARRFPSLEGSQADVEDGDLDVTIVEDAAGATLVGESIRHALGREDEHVRAVRTPRVAVTIGGERDRISVDGEIRSTRKLTASVRPRSLWVPVGEGYDPDPTD